MRQIEFQYDDPLDLIWLAAAKQVGMNVLRSNEVFASWDGSGTLLIGEAESLDADDSLAQLIFHEMCHFLIEGPESWSQPDWGLENAKREHEFACLRLQAALADLFGLRGVLASTTDFRSFYDQLPSDALEGDDVSAVMAKQGFERAQRAPWSETLHAALQRTSELARIVQPLALPSSVWSRAQDRSIFP